MQPLTGVVGGAELLLDEDIEIFEAVKAAGVDARSGESKSTATTRLSSSRFGRLPLLWRMRARGYSTEPHGGQFQWPVQTAVD